MESRIQKSIKYFLALGLFTLITVNSSIADETSLLTVKIIPERANYDGARWRINNVLPPPNLPDGTPIKGDDLANRTYVSNWFRSGQKLRSLPDGLHIVEFRDIKEVNENSPCIKADNVIASIQPGNSSYREGNYSGEGCNDENVTLKSANPASAPILSIVIQPAKAITDGAKWQLDSDGHWRASGDKVTDLSNGDHTIEYKDVTSGPCTETPPLETLTLYDNQEITWPVTYRGDGCN